MQRRRSAKRWARRLPVRFWHSGAPEVRTGHTVNISAGGMFIGTSQPLKSGVKIRIEVLSPEAGFVVQGVVTHSRRVAQELNKVSKSGMGVRFLTPEELIEGLLGRLAEEPAAKAVTPARPAAGGRRTRPGYAVRFRDVAQFLRVFERDIYNGGLFVATREPAPLDRVVTVEIHPPLPGVEPVRLAARVVQRLELPPGGGDADQQRSGMGVEFLDRDEISRRLGPIVRRVRR